MNKLKYKVLCNVEDPQLSINYTLIEVNAQHLSAYLKNSLKAKSINPEDYNVDAKKSTYESREEIEASRAIPLEIYTYQNFFLLEKQDGEFILLDGFRRLLWYDVPNTNILVRVYGEELMPNSNILKLLVYLNHTKFFGGLGSYYDRGFALALRTLFTVDITTYYSAFDSYLAHEYQAVGYSFNRRSKSAKNLEIKDRILNPMFVSDIQFIQSISLDASNIVDHYFGAMIYQFRTEYPTLVLDVQDFLTRTKSNKVLMDLVQKYKTAPNSGFERKYASQVFEMYVDVLKTMAGAESQESYAEAHARAKDLTASIKKQKSWVKLSNHKNLHTFLAEIRETKKISGKYPEVKVIVYPNREGKDLLPCGVYDDFVLKSVDDSLYKVLYPKRQAKILNTEGIIIGGEKFSGYSGSSFTYDKISNGKSWEDRKDNDVQVWLKLK